MPEIKKEISQISKANDKKSPEKKTNQKKLWCFLGGCCCLLILIAMVFVGITPFFFSFFSSGADTKKPTPSATSSTSIKTTSTPTPTAKTTQSQGYPDPSPCEHLQLVDSIPTNINPSNPGLKKDIKTHYYQVYGYTPYQVRAQLNECGSKSGGEAYDAYTSYYLNWAYNYNYVASGCGVKDATVGVKVDYFYPKWDDPGNAQAGLAANWQRYMTNLITHEEGHKDLAVEAGRAILDAISVLPPQSTCEETQSLVSSTGNNIFDDYNAREKAYDDQTNHGETQGAYFP